MQIRTNRKKTSLAPFLLKVLFCLAFAVAVLIVLPAAIPDTEAGLGDVTFPYDDKLPDADQVITPGAYPHLVIVYPERDAWGEEQARIIERRLSARFHANFIVVSDSDYIALDAATLSLYNAEPSLTVTLGINALLDGSYLENLSRLGSTGLEIVSKDNRIDIVSASPERINEGTASFLEAVEYQGGKYTVSDGLFMSDARPSEETSFAPDLVTDGQLNILTFSYIDSNSYTLRAFEGIVAEKKPDLIIFNGNVDGSATTRHELAVMWQDIADVLKKTNTPWCFTPGDLSGNIPRITVCQVISSFEGCIRPISGRDSAAFSLTVANTEGIVTATVYVADIFDNNGALCEKIEADSALYERASSHERAVIAVMPAISNQIFGSAEGLSKEFVSDRLTDVYDALTVAGCNNFICSGDSVSPSLIDFENGRLALCGSIGFDSKGPGGRFDYNNRLRCAISVNIEARRAGYSEVALGYVCAADLGLNER
ncbi:MAG: hypothetical protein ACI3XI_06185 [Eubacteriales bacterium]